MSSPWIRATFRTALSLLLLCTLAGVGVMMTPAPEAEANTSCFCGFGEKVTEANWQKGATCEEARQNAINALFAYQVSCIDGVCDWWVEEVTPCHPHPDGDGSMAVDIKIHYRCYKCPPDPGESP